MIQRHILVSVVFLLGAVGLDLRLAVAQEVAMKRAASEVGVTPGIVVESVSESSALAGVGIQPGDVLLAFKRWANPPANPETAMGRLDSPLDWWNLTMEQASRGEVELRGEREGVPRRWTVPRGDWTSEVRPRFLGEYAELYLQGQKQIEGGDNEGGLRLWQQLRERWSGSPETSVHVWLGTRLAKAWAVERRWGQANAIVESWGKTGSSTLAKSQALTTLGTLALRHSDLSLAESYYLRALKIQEAQAAGSLSLANTLKGLGDVAQDRGDLSLAESRYQRALKIQEAQAAGSLRLANTLNNLGIVARDRGDLSLAESYYQRTLEIDKAQAPGSLSVARTLSNLGLVAVDRGDLSLAESYYQRALEIQETRAPRSLSLASTLNNLGILARELGDLSLAETYLQRALEIQEVQAPGSLSLANTLGNLGNVAFSRGDLSLAEIYYRQVLRIQKAQAPSSLRVAISLNNLGTMARVRGDLLLAKNYHQQALGIQEAQVSGSLDVANTLHNLGNLAFSSGDLSLAESYYQQALGIQRTQAPGSLDVASTLHNLGLVAFSQGNPSLSESYLQQALEIREAQAPGSLSVALALQELGNVAIECGNLSLAATYLQRALEIHEVLALDSLSMASTLANLGVVARKRERFVMARTLLERAVGIWQHSAPDTANHSAALYELSRVARARGHLEKAAGFLDRSLEALEAQTRRLGASRETEGLFRDQKEYFVFQEALSLALERGRPEQAFEVLERSRAQSYLALLAERELVFANLPPELDEKRRQLNVSYDRTIQELRPLSPSKDAERIREILAEQLRLREQQQQIQVEMRKSAPELAALEQPPLSLKEVRHRLDAGTVLLAYSVGKEESFLFILHSEGEFEAHSLAFGTARLQELVEGFRRLIPEARPVNRLGEFRLARLELLAQDLYQLLLAPAQQAIINSQRVLLLPDGPLHLLPFGALRHPSGRFVAEWKPLSFALSATVWARLKGRRASPESSKPPVLAAFGDPQYSTFEQSLQRGTTIADFRFRGAFENCFQKRWGALPASRREVMGIARLFGDGNAQTFLGPKATEEQVKGLTSTPQIVHFAAHACTDPRFPWNSSIVLTLPDAASSDRDNGLLQLWEIMESIRFDAELVVLSACQTAVGQNRGGEGLIGLTRAFQIVGARSVLASLWRVHDQETAEFMVRFYRHYLDGKPKDEALQATQSELIRGPVEVLGEDGTKDLIDASAPFYWAAFQLHGDWQ